MFQIESLLSDLTKEIVTARSDNSDQSTLSRKIESLVLSEKFQFVSPSGFSRAFLRACVEGRYRELLLFKTASMSNKFNPMPMELFLLIQELLVTLVIKDSELDAQKIAEFKRKQSYDKHVSILHLNNHLAHSGESI